MTGAIDDKIKDLERYIVEVASSQAINKLLKEIKADIDSGSLKEKQNYQRLLNIIDTLLSNLAALQAELARKNKKKDLDYVNKSR